MSVLAALCRVRTGRPLPAAVVASASRYRAPNQQGRGFCAGARFEWIIARGSPPGDAADEGQRRPARC